MIITKSPKTYLTGPQVRRRFGGKSHVWLWRMLRRNPNFPRPHRINRQLYFSLDELEAYEASQREPFPQRAIEADAR